MEKNAFSPEEIELSPNSPNSTINLAIIASYALIAMALASFFNIKTPVFSNKTHKNLTISSPDNPQSSYDSGKSSQVD